MKKKSILRLVSFVVFLALLVGAISWCARLLEQKEARKQYEPFFQSKTNFDVLYFGTSHMWNHVLPMEMWKDYGISSYNWGYSNCTPAEEYYILQDVLKYTKPKVIVIDAYGLVEYNANRNGKYKDNKIEQQHVQFDSFPIWSLSKIRASQDVFDTYEHNEDFIWNFIMYHNRWSELGQDDFEVNVTTEKGGRFFTGLGKATFTPVPADSKIELTSVCYPYYLKMIEYCRDRGIQVLGVYLPFAAKEQQQRVANTLGEIVEQYPNCKFVNMLTENILDFETDISIDDHHLNYSGACKVTDWLGQYLREHYELEDYSKNESWIQDYEKYREYKASVLKEETKLATSLVQLADDDFTAEVEIYDETLSRSPRLNKLLENANIVPVVTSSDTGAALRMKVYNVKTKELVSDAYYMFNSDTRILNNIVWQTGWKKNGETWYYYGEEGLMRTGFQEIDGETYFFEPSGVMCTGWRQIDGKWYLFEKGDGQMTRGWRQIAAKWYYLFEDGTMAEGFCEIDGNRYYFDENGHRMSGWIKADGKWYWFDENGVMVAGQNKTIDGKNYTFGNDGVLAGER